jgi:fumarylacetoacetate (FAA) hydrolase
MKLATMRDGSPDGRLLVVSRDLRHAVHAGAVATSLREAVENWESVEARLRLIAESLERGEATGAFALPLRELGPPLPRAWQWLDASAFHSHGDLMERAFKHAPLEGKLTRPLMYQGGSDDFLGPADDIPMPSEADGIDFEAEVAVVTDRVPMGTPAADALRHVRLVMLANDASLRSLAMVEMKTGFGWIQAKPACSVAPFAVTPDELGEAWRDGRVGLELAVDWNGKRFGNANGAAMAYGFHELIAHAARTRSLPAGTIIGSGTVSNENYREIGSSCIAERRGFEIVDGGAPITPFMRFGDRVRMEARAGTGATPFGAIDQVVVASRAASI